MKESGEKMKKWEKLPPNVFVNGEDHFNSACLGLL